MGSWHVTSCALPRLGTDTPRVTGPAPAEGPLGAAPLPDTHTRARAREKSLENLTPGDEYLILNGGKAIR